MSAENAHNLQYSKLWAFKCGQLSAGYFCFLEILYQEIKDPSVFPLQPKGSGSLSNPPTVDVDCLLVLQFEPV